jgi:putative membrane protein
MGGDMGFHGGGWFGLGLIPMLLFWVFVILAIAALLKWLRGPTSSAPESTAALQILEERYARGEISREEYLRTKEDLHG